MNILQLISSVLKMRGFEAADLEKELVINDKETDKYLRDVTIKKHGQYMVLDSNEDSLSAGIDPSKL